MLLTPDKAMELLLDLFKANPELDSASVLVKWGDAVRDYDEQLVKSVQRPLPQFYTIQHGVMVEQTSDESHSFYLYQPDAKYRVLASDVPTFAKEHGLPLKALMDVLEGRELDINGYRTYYNQTSMSKLYQPAREVSEDDFVADIGEARRLQRQPAKHPYSTPVEPTEQDFKKASK